LYGNGWYRSFDAPHSSQRLKSEFDKALREGAEFSALKPIYLQIKELEWHLKVMEWEKSTHHFSSQKTGPYSEGLSYL
jgi:hypothetical protein